jgi:hypothetical protein
MVGETMYNIFLAGDVKLPRGMLRLFVLSIFTLGGGLQGTENLPHCFALFLCYIISSLLSEVL